MKILKQVLKHFKQNYIKKINYNKKIKNRSINLYLWKLMMILIRMKFKLKLLNKQIIQTLNNQNRQYKTLLKI